MKKNLIRIINILALIVCFSLSQETNVFADHMHRGGGSWQGNGGNWHGSSHNWHGNNGGWHGEEHRHNNWGGTTVFFGISPGYYYSNDYDNNSDDYQCVWVSGYYNGYGWVPEHRECGY